MKKVAIMGAGPAGLAAAYELSKKSIAVTMFEADEQVGGISKTIEYKGNYFDLGGHRFFTKIEDVNSLWMEVLQDNFKKTPRLSRIFYKNKFFNYPITPANAFFGVGPAEAFLIVLSYFKTKIFPFKQEESFEQWVSNRFGKKLYSIFFKTYTEKVWGIPCSSIQAEWAAQRIKGLSLLTAISNAFFKPKKKNIKTLINEFDYPVLGPGMMYTEMKNKIEHMGGKVNINTKVIKVNHNDFQVTSVEYMDSTGKTYEETGDHFISSIPLTELVSILSPSPAPDILSAAKGLDYRSIITIDIIINKKDLFPDNWIYIHSPEVKLGRIQNFKNWSSHMVKDPNKTTLGLEYFCTENDDFWNKTDEELYEIAVNEVEKIRICKKSEIEDYTVVRVPKAYPVYMLGYKDNVVRIENYIKQFTNLQCVGRYGLFKYNNMDHSILTGLYAARNIIDGAVKNDVWQVNTDEEYHEEKSGN